MGAIAVGLALVASGQVSLGANADNQPASQKSGAQEQKAASAQTVSILPEMTVSSHYIGVPYSSSGVSVSIIDPKSFEERGIQTLSGALSRMPGVYMLDDGSTGQRGSMAYMTVRGVNLAGGTSLMIDGMRVSDVRNSMNYDSLGSGPGQLYGQGSLFDLGGAELVKGPQGAVYGNNSYAGVLALSTPEGEGKPSLRIFNEAGSFGSYTGSVTSQGKIKKLGYFVGVGFETTENDLHYLGAPGPYAYPNPGQANQYGDFRQWQEALRLSYDINKDNKLSLTYRRMDSVLDNPSVVYGEDYMPFVARDRFDMRSNLLTATLDSNINKMWSTTFMMGYYDRHFKDNLIDGNSWTDHSKFQTEWRNALTWNKEWKTVLGMAWDRTDYTCLNNYVDIDEMENNLAWFAEQMWSPTRYLDFSIVGRLEHSSIWNNNATWRFAGSWKVNGKEDSPTRLFGSVGSGFRAPSAWERYADCNVGGWPYIGNPDLKISRSLGGDFGIEQRLVNNHYLTVTGFWTRINDLIVSPTRYKDPVNYGGGYTTWENASHGTMTGVEAAFRGEFSDAWKTGYNLAYTYVMPKDNDGKQLLGTARNTVSGEIHISPLERLTTGLGLLSASNRCDTTTSNGKYLDNYATLRWFVRYQVTENMTLHFRIENLFNEKYIVTNDYNFGPLEARGIGVFGGVTLEF